MIDDLNDCQSERAMALAIAIERHNAYHFAEWSHRFLPYDADTADFLQALAEEERDHERQLIDAFERCFGRPPQLDNLPATASYQSGLNQLMEHFFVVNPEMANSLLKIALRVEQYTRQYYLDLVLNTSDPELAEVYGRLAEYEEDHEREFRQRIARETKSPPVHRPL